MCPVCISIVAVAVAGASLPEAAIAFLARRAERVPAPRKTQFTSVPQKESGCWDPRSQKRDPGHPSTSPLGLFRRGG
jgi:hypothetical protein